MFTVGKLRENTFGEGFVVYSRGCPYMLPLSTHANLFYRLLVFAGLLHDIKWFNTSISSNLSWIIFRAVFIMGPFIVVVLCRAITRQGANQQQEQVGGNRSSNRSRLRHDESGGNEDTRSVISSAVNMVEVAKRVTTNAVRGHLDMWKNEICSFLVCCERK